MENVHEYARTRTRIASDRMKRRYDVGSTRETFKCGDAVWLCNPQRKKGLSPKLSDDWEGPYLVTKQINELLYELEFGSLHVRSLALFIATDYGAICLIGTFRLKF